MHKQDRRGRRCRWRIVTLAIVAFSLAALMLPASASELHRLRFLPSDPLIAGQQSTFTVCIDSGIYPEPSPGDSDPVGGLIGLVFGVEIPAPLQLVDATVDSALLEDVFAGAPPPLFFADVVEGGITFTLFIAPDQDALIPPGMSRPVLHLLLSAPEDAQPTDVSLRFSAELGEGPVPNAFIAWGGIIEPHLRAGTVSIVAPSPVPVPVVIPEDPFPEPTAAELNVQLWEPPEPVTAEPIGGGGAAAEATAPSPACVYETELGDPPSLVSYPGEFVSQGQVIQQAIDNYSGSGDWVVVVQGGPIDYVENITIDVSDFDGYTLYLYAESGPDNTTIDGNDFGPCVTISQSGSGAGRVVLGWSDVRTTDPTPPSPHTDWYGFTLTNGGNTTEGPGIKVDSITGTVEIRGNWITLNPLDPTASDPITGGGISVQNCDDVQIIFNEISWNHARYNGGGIYLLNSNVQVANNWLHDNTFAALSSIAVYGMGGGISTSGGDILLCDNFIFNNKGKQGCGGYLEMTDSGPSGDMRRIHALRNDIHHNEPWTPPNPTTSLVSYLGGGLLLKGQVDQVGNTLTRELLIANNSIHENSIEVPAGHSPGWPGQPTELGGGLHADFAFDDNNTIAPFEPYIVGNFIFLNKAVEGAGGAYVGIFPASGQQFFVYNNTFNDNELTSATDGVDVLLPFVTDPNPLSFPFLGYSKIVADSNIVFQFTAPFGTTEWFAQCDPTGIRPPTSTFWSYSQIPQLAVTGCNGAPGDGYDIFGNPSVLYNDSADPLLVASTDPHLSDTVSPCFNSGDPAFVSGSFPIASDIDGDPRFWDPLDPSIDRGADELLAYPFIRGDVDGNGTVNIADLMLVFRLYQDPSYIAPNCQDSWDVDDLGDVRTLWDWSYLYAYLAAAGPPPPPPFPDCGHDPTADSLDPCDTDQNDCL